MGTLLYVTGTDTGAGKTVLTALLLAHLRASGRHALAVKPFSSGSRQDAEILHGIQEGELPLDEVNPFHFREPLAPLVAARRAGQSVNLRRARNYLRAVSERCELLLIEGAGGLLSPLGERFTLADLIEREPGHVFIAAPNRLGVLNQALLTVEALQRRRVRRPILVLRGVENADPSARSNLAMLQEWLPAVATHTLPLLKGNLTQPENLRRQAEKLCAKLAPMINAILSGKPGAKRS